MSSLRQLTREWILSRRCRTVIVVTAICLLLVNFYSQLRRHPLHTWTTTSVLQLQPLKVTPLKQQPPRICLGRDTYKEWIDELFALAPPAPNCSAVESFLSHYTTTSPQWQYGTIVMQRNVNDSSSSSSSSSSSRYYHDAYEIVDAETKKPASGGRKGFFATVWRNANIYRTLPPNLELLVYINDKPRVNHLLNPLPVFVIAGHFPAGSGSPKEWLGYVPFPSHFFEMEPKAEVNTEEEEKEEEDALQQQQQQQQQYIDLKNEFLQKRPMVYYRGQFSENAWSRYNRSDEYISTPRFKLANATKYRSDHDVLDIAITGIATAQGAQAEYIRHNLYDLYNITMGDYVSASDGNAMISLSVPGNGWPGATTMRALLSDTAMFKIIDTTIDNEGYNRDTGEIHFPLLIPYVHYIPVEYDTIASTAREWLTLSTKDMSNTLTTSNSSSDNQTTTTPPPSPSIEALFQINIAATKFGQRFLGYECALDIIELLAWRYYDYVQSGCDTAFAHVPM